MRIALSLLISLMISAATAQERGQVRLGYNRAWVSPALLIALTQGHFKQAGVGIAERSFDNPADIVQAIGPATWTRREPRRDPLHAGSRA